MKCYILMGSPRKNGNTAALLEPIIDEMEKNGVSCETDWLYDMDIKGCVACLHCQHNMNEPDCAVKDDMQNVIKKALECDILIYATPIYSWYCTAPMKAAMDRLIYCCNKTYMGQNGPRLLEGKKFASITSSGYRPEKGNSVWNMGLTNYSKHGGMNYIGVEGEKDHGYDHEFMSEDKAEHMRLFAREILSK